MREANQGRFHPQRPEKYVGNVHNIFYRSGLEFRTMRYFDRTPGIIQWCSEEVRIPYVSPADGNRHTYYPDFLIRMKHADGTLKNVLIEVKPSRQCVAPKPPKSKKAGKRYLVESMTYNVNQAKWAAAREWCTRQNSIFMVLTEKHIDGT